MKKETKMPSKKAKKPSSTKLSPFGRELSAKHPKATYELVIESLFNYSKKFIKSGSPKAKAHFFDLTPENVAEVKKPAYQKKKLIAISLEPLFYPIYPSEDLLAFLRRKLPPYLKHTPNFILKLLLKLPKLLYVLSLIKLRKNSFTIASVYKVPVLNIKQDWKSLALTSETRLAIQAWYTSLGGNRYSISHLPVKHKNHLQLPMCFFEMHYEDRMKEMTQVKKRLAFLPKQKFCIFTASNPKRELRNTIFKKLSQYRPVDACGTVFNNAPRIPYDKSLIESYKPYKFVIAVENCLEDYFYNTRVTYPYLAGAIPITHLPRDERTRGEINFKSVIDFGDFDSVAELVTRVIQLDQDEEAYRKVLLEPFFINNKIPENHKLATLDKWLTKVFQE